MKNKIKKTASVLLALVIVLSAAPLSGFARISASALDASGTLSKTVSYTFYEATGTLTISGTGKMPDYDFSVYSPFSNNSSIKNVVIENGITSIGEHSFSECSGLTSVALPESVTYINYNAFSGCTSLASVDFSDSLTYIGSSAFTDCTGLTSVDLPDSLTHLGSGTFAGCTGLTDITIPENLTELYENTFAGCTSLTGITIPENVTRIDLAFVGCTGITDIEVDKNNSVFDSRNNCNAIIETETNKLIFGCKNTLIPDSVTCIDEYAFSMCKSIESIIIPDSVTSIGFKAFAGCSELKNVTVPDSVTNLGAFAFERCQKLEELVLGENIVSFDGRVLNNCDAKKIICIGADNITIENPDSFVNDSTFIVMAGSNAETYIKNKGYKYVPYRIYTATNQSNNKEYNVISFDSTLTVEEDKDYEYLRYIVTNNLSATYIHFKELTLKGVQPSEVLIDEYGNIEYADGDTTLYNVYFYNVLHDEPITFEDVKNAVESDNSDAIVDDVIVELGQGETDMNFFERIKVKLQEIVTAALKVLSTALNKVISIFKKK